MATVDGAATAALGVAVATTWTPLLLQAMGAATTAAHVIGTWPVRGIRQAWSRELDGWTGRRSPLHVKS